MAQEPQAAPAPPALPAGEPPPASSFVSEEAPPADGRIIDLAELPASVRSRLPPLRISGHVWSEEPALRLLTVDDRLLREGGEAAPGVLLRQITADGAIFDYQGWRVQVAGIRR